MCLLITIKVTFILAKAQDFLKLITLQWLEIRWQWLNMKSGFSKPNKFKFFFITKALRINKLQVNSWLVAHVAVCLTYLRVIKSHPT